MCLQNHPIVYSIDRMKFCATTKSQMKGKTTTKLRIWLTANTRTELHHRFLRDVGTELHLKGVGTERHVMESTNTKTESHLNLAQNFWTTLHLTLKENVRAGLPLKWCINTRVESLPRIWRPLLMMKMTFHPGPRGGGFSGQTWWLMIIYSAGGTLARSDQAPWEETERWSRLPSSCSRVCRRTFCKYYKSS